MRALLFCSAIIVAPCLALADPQCVLPSPLAAMPARVDLPAADPARPTAPSPSPMLAAETGGSSARPSYTSTGVAALDHVLASGAQLTEAGTSHGLRTVVARSDNQFRRMYVASGGTAIVVGLMSELSTAELLAMAPGLTTELGNHHGLRGIFVRNGDNFQVFYATPNGDRVIPGVMFDAQGKNLTRDQVAGIPGAIPTVVIGDAPPGSAPPAQAPAGSLLGTVEKTTFGTVGSASAPRIWVFVDPRCAWSVRAMDQLRPFVADGRISLAVVPVAVLDRDGQGPSTVAAKAMLSLSQEAMVVAWGGNTLGTQTEPAADGRLAGNMLAARTIGLRGTPTLVWRKADGTEGRADGLPKDLDSLVASVGR